MKESMRARIFKRMFWFTVGSLALALGVLGIVLPLLPTTPLVLLATFAFAKSTPSIEAWLRRHSVFGPIIIDWQRNGAIAHQYKVLAVGTMLAVLMMSYIFAVAPFVLILQALCMSAAAVFILTRPS
ncbi:YbaN family protein (plasmid) [Sulfitobacter sp. W027]|uniref:YbaN family protein n=1 Tax=Sulfitobacter sp. W027 TaxID=2867025 RepID=UPI0021A68F5A|nr:YbaN family protein [Sulfitobacter sp. W027]UWR35314.1 YbaN family protein [Sulfitobacter sp. W027]